MLNKLFVLSFALLVGVNGWAGDKARNGGSVIECADGVPKEMLDTFEAREVFSLNLWPGFGATPVEKALDIVANRLPVMDAGRRQIYTAWINEFMKRAEFATGVALPELADSNPVAVPVNCKLVQIAIQRDFNLPIVKRYLINGDLWNKMDVDNQAALILHEVIYREAILRGQSDSVNSRLFSGLLQSSNAEQLLDPDLYASVLHQVGFDKRDVPHVVDISGFGITALEAEEKAAEAGVVQAKAQCDLDGIPYEGAPQYKNNSAVCKRLDNGYSCASPAYECLNW